MCRFHNAATWLSLPTAVLPSGAITARFSVSALFAGVHCAGPIGEPLGPQADDRRNLRVNPTTARRLVKVPIRKKLNILRFHNRPPGMEPLID
jgi:hypothetical protein